MRIISFWLAFILASPTLAAECVQVAMNDVNGLPVPMEKPLIGFVMPGGGAPVVDMAVLPGASLIAGAKAECPSALLKTMRDLFDASCLTNEQRAATMKENNTTMENVNQRCRDLYASLDSKN
jgi:hypothetical protein